jgi:serine/threonine protein kinase
MVREPKSFDGLDECCGLPTVGQVLGGKYEIERILGIGGMAAVFAATHLALRQKVAIKFLLPALSEDAGIVERFMREGRAAARIRSEHVVRVFDVDEVEGRPYLVLEYLDGEDLAALVAEGPQPVLRAVEFVLQVCEALAEAHVAGIIHRDLKPANLFLCHRADGSPCVKILDFGISKILRTEDRDSGFRTLGTLPMTVMGSPHYMSPEQIASSTDVDERTDIWSMGAILHELLTGRPPFESGTITGLCARILTDRPPLLTKERADVPEALEAVVLRCLEKERVRRFANVAELARALVAFGPAEAEASAARISRVVEGGITVRHSEPSRPGEPASIPALRPRVRAADLVEGVPRPPMEHPVGAYLFMVLSLFGLAGSIGWKIATQARDAHDVAGRTQPAAVAPPPPTPPPPKPLPSVASTAGAAIAATATIAPPPPSGVQTGSIAPIPVGPARTVPSPPVHRASPPRRPAISPRTPPRPSIVEPLPEDDPFDVRSVFPPAPPTPSAEPPKPPPEDLFDERK